MTETYPASPSLEDEPNSPILLAEEFQGFVHNKPPTKPETVAETEHLRGIILSFLKATRSQPPSDDPQKFVPIPAATLNRSLAEYNNQWRRPVNIRPDDRVWLHNYDKYRQTHLQFVFSYLERFPELERALALRDEYAETGPAWLAQAADDVAVVHGLALAKLRSWHDSRRRDMVRHSLRGRLIQ